MNNGEGTLFRFLNGVSRTLTIANKAIPVYNQAKPIIKSMNNTYKNFKNNKDNLSNMIKLMRVKNQINKDMNKSIQPPNITTRTNISNINNPKFFL